MNTGSDRQNLKKPERHAQILLELRLAPHVRISDLAKTFGVTTETVRRDIAELSAQGHLQKSHGGASPRAPGTHRVLNERQRERVDERQKLAQLAVGLVDDGQSLMVDAGATTMEFARALAISGKTSTVITNSLQVAMILGTSAVIRVLMTPGDYLNEEAALTGTETCAFLRRYHVDACFVGASALDQSGVSESVAGFAEVKRTMIERCRAPNFLIDGSKFGKRHLAMVAEVGEIGTLITDTRPKGGLADALQTHCVEALLPQGFAKPV
ncbi:MAG: DeoR/GlpR family DNA-binding transcription regulator [Sedimentitalea sp.]|uniref:DeoR/GlpR family DNA-binding transcription regulator n=1 Tax=Sedimentitalea sp. TaxID=2048915 RepID=UPI00326415D9